MSSEIEEALRGKIKSQHLSSNQTEWICKQLRMKKQTEGDMMRKYEISFSTLRRITRSQKAHAMNYRTDIISTYLKWLTQIMSFLLLNLLLKEIKHRLHQLIFVNRLKRWIAHQNQAPCGTKSSKRKVFVKLQERIGSSFKSWCRKTEMVEGYFLSSSVG